MSWKSIGDKVVEETRELSLILKNESEKNDDVEKKWK